MGQVQVGWNRAKNETLESQQLKQSELKSRAEPKAQVDQRSLSVDVALVR